MALVVVVLMSVADVGMKLASDVIVVALVEGVSVILLVVLISASDTTVVFISVVDVVTKLFSVVPVVAIDSISVVLKL